MTSGLHARLAAMMFLQYFAAGAILPILSHYLKNYLGFAPFQVGVVLAMPAVAATLAPLWVNVVADRYLRAEKVIALCHALAAMLMFALSFQDSFPAFVALYLLYSLVFMPCMGLTNTVTFHHATDEGRNFATVRTYGTVGWFAVAWLFGYFWLQRNGGVAESRLPDALLLCAATSAVFAVYALTLPRSEAAGQKTVTKPWESLAVFARPGLMLLCLATFVNSILNQFYSYGAGPYLSAAGFTDQWIMPSLSLGQFTEMIIMALMAIWLGRFSIKALLIGGVAFQMARFAIFAFTESQWLAMAGVSLHGFTYALYFVTAYIYLNNHCHPWERAGAQQVFNIIIGGVGLLAGSLTAGGVGEWAAGPDGAIDYHLFWTVPMVIAAGLTILLAVFFREPARGNRQDGQDLNHRDTEDTEEAQ
ncbi:MAG: MFS transporter [Candidatus Hydrogenedentota bacterium]